MPTDLKKRLMAAMERTSLTPAQRLIMVYFILREGDDLTLTPMSFVAAQLGLSRRTLYTGLEKLVNLRLITRKEFLMMGEEDGNKRLALARTEFKVNDQVLRP